MYIHYTIRYIKIVFDYTQVIYWFYLDDDVVVVVVVAHRIRLIRYLCSISLCILDIYITDPVLMLQSFNRKINKLENELYGVQRGDDTSNGCEKL